MLSRVVLAVVVGVAVTLACNLVGGVLASLNVSLAVAVGSFLQTFSGVLGVLAALWYFFNGYTWHPKV